MIGKGLISLNLTILAVGCANILATTAQAQKSSDNGTVNVRYQSQSRIGLPFSLSQYNNTSTSSQTTKTKSSQNDFGYFNLGMSAHVELYVKPGPLQIDISHFPKNYRLKIYVDVYEDNTRTRTLQKCRFRINDSRRGDVWDSCIIDKVRYVNILFSSTSLERSYAVQPKGSKSYYVNGQEVWVGVGNAKFARWASYSGTRRDSDQKQQRCWTNINGATACW
jgi:hypothetical protein